MDARDTYQVVCRAIRQQFDEIECFTQNQEACSEAGKDIIIDKLANQVQYIYTQYTTLFERSLSFDDELADLIDWQSLSFQLQDNIQLKRLVCDQLKSAINSYRNLQTTVRPTDMQQISLDSIAKTYNEFRLRSYQFRLDDQDEVTVSSQNFQHILLCDFEYFLQRIEYLSKENESLTSIIQESQEQLNILQKDILETRVALENEKEVNLQKQIYLEEAKLVIDTFLQSNQQKSEDLIEELKSEKLLQRDFSVSKQIQCTSLKINKNKRIFNLQNNKQVPENQISQHRKFLKQLLEKNALEIKEELLERFQVNQKEEEAVDVIIGKQQYQQNLQSMLVKQSVSRINTLVQEVEGRIGEGLINELNLLSSRIEQCKHMEEDMGNNQRKQMRDQEKFLEHNQEQPLNIIKESYQLKTKELLSKVNFQENQIQQIFSDAEVKQTLSIQEILDLRLQLELKEKLLQEMSHKLSQTQLEQQIEKNQLESIIEEQAKKHHLELSKAIDSKNRKAEKLADQFEKSKLLQSELTSSLKFKQQLIDFEKEKRNILSEVRQIRSEYQRSLLDHAEQVALLHEQLEIKDNETYKLHCTFIELEAFSKRQLEVIKEQQEDFLRMENQMKKQEGYRWQLEESKVEISYLHGELAKQISELSLSKKEAQLRSESINKYEELFKSQKIKEQQLIQENQQTSTDFENKTVMQKVQIDTLSLQLINLQKINEEKEKNSQQQSLREREITELNQRLLDSSNQIILEKLKADEKVCSQTLLLEREQLQLQKAFQQIEILQQHQDKQLTSQLKEENQIIGFLQKQQNYPLNCQQLKNKNECKESNNGRASTPIKDEVSHNQVQMQTETDKYFHSNLYNSSIPLEQKPSSRKRMSIDEELVKLNNLTTLMKQNGFAINNYQIQPN